MIGIRKGQKVIQPMMFPDKKKPCLMILSEFGESNQFIKVATFNSKEAAELFMEYLAEMFGLDTEADR